MTFGLLPSRGQKMPFAVDKEKKSTSIVTKIESIPHHALVVYGGFYCSGSLIKSQTVLSAASCFLKRDKQNVVVKFGTNTMTDPGQVISVIDLKLHEYFDHKINWNNDIALLILMTHVKFSENIKKIRLIQQGTLLNAGMRIEVSGWSYSTLHAKYSNSVISSQMQIISKNECKQAYKNNLISASNFCAKYQYDRRLSDNGGGATWNGDLVGFVSFGAANKNEPYVAVLTNISYYYGWIELNSQMFLKKYCRLYKRTNLDHTEHVYGDNARSDRILVY